MRNIDDFTKEQVKSFYRKAYSVEKLTLQTISHSKYTKVQYKGVFYEEF